MGDRGWSRLRSLALGGWVLPLIGVVPAAAQSAAATAQPVNGSLTATVAPRGRPISLEEALRLAEETSEQVTISRAGVLRARGQQLQARSQLLPQLAASVGYTRTLASQFSRLTSAAVDTTAPQNCPTGRFQPNPGLPVDQRLDSLEHTLQCGGGNPFAGLSRAGFGAKNQYSVGLQFSQNLFTGGRVTGQIAEANASRNLADIALASTRAQLLLDVTQAYYDAALADRLLAIAQGTLSQSQSTLNQVRLARQVGNQPEFELLRAQVAFENQQPVVIQRQAQRDIAFLRLKQLLNLSSDQAVTLSTALGDTVSMAPLVRLASDIVRDVGDTATANRAPVRQANQSLRAQESALRVARAERIPALSLVSQWGRVAYPQSGVPSWSDFATNWTVGVSLSVPLFTGGRITGDNMVAQAGVMEARARLQQTQELAALDTRSALAALRAAEATYYASAGTATQASRAYQIADVRYREGISTQLELNDSRLMVEQAEANRAQAARDLQIARVRLALLPALPLSAGSTTTNASAAAQAGTSTAAPSTGATTSPTMPAQPQAQQPQQGTQQQPQGGTSTVSASRVPLNP